MILGSLVLMVGGSTVDDLHIPGKTPNLRSAYRLADALIAAYPPIPVLVGCAEIAHVGVAEEIHRSMARLCSEIQVRVILYIFMKQRLILRHNEMSWEEEKKDKEESLQLVCNHTLKYKREDTIITRSPPSPLGEKKRLIRRAFYPVTAELLPAQKLGGTSIQQN